MATNKLTYTGIKYHNEHDVVIEQCIQEAAVPDSTYIPSPRIQCRGKQTYSGEWPTVPIFSQPYQKNRSENLQSQHI